LQKIDAAAGSVILSDARSKLLAVARTRRAPMVDRTVLTDANARMVSALLTCAAAFDKPDLRAFALRTLDRLRTECTEVKRGAAHCIPPGGKPEFSCLANDEAALAVACLDAADATGDRKYVDAARTSLERLVQRFRDSKTGAYLDCPANDRKVPPEPGLLSEPIRPFTDTPGPSLNALAAQAHLRLGKLAKDDVQAEYARGVVRAFGAVLDRLGPSVASLILVADEIDGKKP
jgi:hypothetical protein